MLSRTIIALSILSLHLDLACAGQTVMALNYDEIPAVTDISGFRSAQDKINNVEVRLLEADVSADVARNPVALFLVITDNAPVHDTQTHVWRLPNAVAKVEKIELGKSVLKISVISDGVADEKAGKFPEKNETIVTTYSIDKGVLSDKISVTTSSP